MPISTDNFLPAVVLFVVGLPVVLAGLIYLRTWSKKNLDKEECEPAPSIVHKCPHCHQSGWKSIGFATQDAADTWMCRYCSYWERVTYK